MEKLSFDLYYMSLAFMVAQRSFDPNTKCGCILVSKDNRILSTGYNGPIKGINDDKIPLDRDKLYYMIHSEINALLSYTGSHDEIQDAKCYVTIQPCHECTRALLQKGIKYIYCSNLPLAKCMDEKSMSAQELMLKEKSIKINIIDYKDILDTIKISQDYIIRKMEIKTC